MRSDMYWFKFRLQDRKTLMFPEPEFKIVVRVRADTRRSALNKAMSCVDAEFDHDFLQWDHKDYLLSVTEV